MRKGQNQVKGKNNEGDNDLGQLANLPTEVATEFVNWEPDWYKKESPGDSAKDSEYSTLGKAEKKYLRAIIDYPKMASTEYPKIAGMSTRKALKLRRRLTDLGYIREHVVSTANRGRPSIILEPTPKALQELQAISKEKPEEKL